MKEDRPQISIPADAIIEGNDPLTGFKYHSRRISIPAEGPDCPSAKRRGGFRQWLRSNRGLALTFVNIIVLAFVFVLYLFVLLPRFQRDSIPELGLEFEADLQSFEDGLLSITLEAKASPRASLPPEGAQFLFFLIYQEDDLSRATLREALASLEEDQDLSALSPSSLESLFRIQILGSEAFRDLLPDASQKRIYSSLMQLPEEGSRKIEAWIIVRVEGQGEALISVNN